MDATLWALGLLGILAAGSLAWALAGRRAAGEAGLRIQLESLAAQLGRSQGETVDHLIRRIEEVDRRSSETSHQLGQMMQSRLEAMAQRLSEGLGQVNASSRETTTAIGERLDRAAQVIQGVQNQLGTLSETSKRIFDVGKDISTLSDILRAPKLRGNLGEFLLADLLGQILPRDRFVLQHRFRSGDVVDALVRLSGGDVPVDAKFPLENFRRSREAEDEKEREAARRQFPRDVKKHIDAIAAKYINPEEGTLDFALMYIPAENVYHEAMVDGGEIAEGVFPYALERKVIPVSPSVFYAHLMTIAFGLRGLRIEANAKAVLAGLAKLQGEFAEIQKHTRTLGGHLKNAAGSYDSMVRLGDRFLGRLEEAASPALSATAEEARPVGPEPRGRLDA